MPSAFGSPAAARVGDPVTHSAALFGLVEGALLGAALGVIVVASGGTAVPLLVAASAAAGGASLGGAVGKYWGEHHTTPCGSIVTGSPNVNINGRPAAFVGSLIACAQHGGPQMVAEGSSRVNVNGRPAAREGDHGSCGCRIASGSPNVFMGGAAVSPIGYAGEVPWYADAALLVLGLFGGGALMAVKGLGAAAIAAKLGSQLVGSQLGGSAGHYIGGKFFPEGSRGQEIVTLAGSVVGGMGGEGLAGGLTRGLRGAAAGAARPPRVNGEFRAGGLSAEEANAPWIAKGYSDPYAAGTRARDIVLQRDRVFARVHGEGNQARSWMMRPEEIDGLSAAQIREKFALPDVPTYVSEVHLPAGTQLRLGVVGAQPGWGAGGAIQYEFQPRATGQYLPADVFQNRRPLP